MSANNAPVIDLKVIDELRNLSPDRHFIPDLLKKLILELHASIMALEQIANSDKISVRFYAHRIKGMAANVGAERLRGTAKLLEEHYETLESDALKAQVSSLKAECADLEKEIAKLQLLY